MGIIVAAGLSSRMAGLDKQFTLLGRDEKPLLAHTLAIFEASPLVDEYVLVLNEANLLRGRALAFEEGWQKLKKVVKGGPRRQDSVFNGLKALQAEAPGEEPEWVMIHDGARPFVTSKILEDGLAAAREFCMYVIGTAGHVDHGKSTLVTVSYTHLTLPTT